VYNESPETRIGAFNTGFDTGNLHRTTEIHEPGYGVRVSHRAEDQAELTARCVVAQFEVENKVLKCLSHLSVKR